MFLAIQKRLRRPKQIRDAKQQLFRQAVSLSFFVTDGANLIESEISQKNVTAGL